MNCWNFRLFEISDNVTQKSHFGFSSYFEIYSGPNCEFKIKSSDRVGILHSTKPPSAYSAMTHVKKHPKALSDIEICTHNICLNGGTCLQVDSSSTVCLCQYRYNGPFCELEIKPMSTVPVFQPQLSPGPIMVTRLITVKTRVGLMGNVVSQTAKLPCFWNVPNPCLNGGKVQNKNDKTVCLRDVNWHSFKKQKRV